MAEYEKRGYLLENFRLFHMRSQGETTVEFHYHEFCKVLFLIRGGGSYFIDGYGKTFDYEDRARIMEYTMINDRYARLIMKKPALRNKLSAMVAAVREVFDTTGWENVLWEQYF